MTRPLVKICGVARPGDADLAADLGADLIGLNFYPPSPRYLSVERAVEIRDALGPFVQTVALFVNPDAAQVAQAPQRVRPPMLQFHGEETPEFCAQFGTPIGRLVTRYALLPLLGSLAVVEGLQHMVGPLMKKLVGWEPVISTTTTQLGGAICRAGAGLGSRRRPAPILRRG